MGQDTLNAILASMGLSCIQLTRTSIMPSIQCHCGWGNFRYFKAKSKF